MTTEQDIAYIAIDVRVADALERIATALEQGILDGLDEKAVAAERGAQIVAGLRGDPYPTDLPFPTDEVVDLPPIVRAVPNQPAYQPPAPARTAPPQTQACPVHNTPWKLVPAGVSKKTGNAYNAFWACSTAGCNQRP